MSVASVVIRDFTVNLDGNQKEVAKLADKDVLNKENTKSKDKRRLANNGKRRRKRDDPKNKYKNKYKHK